MSPVTRATNIDRVQSAIVVALYVCFVLIVLTGLDSDRAFVLGVVTTIAVLLGIAGIGLGEGDPSRWELVVISFGAGILVFLPALNVDRPDGPWRLAAAFLALWLLQSTWIVARFPRQRHMTGWHNWPKHVVNGVSWGLGIALGFSILVTVLYGIGLLQHELGATGPPLEGNYWVILAAYALGGTAGGALVGLLRPVWHVPLGLWAAGIVGGFCAYGSMALIMSALDIGSMAGADVTKATVLGLALGSIIGPPIALSWE